MVVGVCFTGVEVPPTEVKNSTVYAVHGAAGMLSIGVFFNDELEYVVIADGVGIV